MSGLQTWKTFQVRGPRANAAAQRMSPPVRGDSSPAQGQLQHQPAPNNRHADVQSKVLQERERISTQKHPHPSHHSPSWLHTAPLERTPSTLTAFSSRKLRMDPSKWLLNS